MQLLHTYAINSYKSHLVQNSLWICFFLQFSDSMEGCNVESSSSLSTLFGFGRRSMPCHSVVGFAFDKVSYENVTRSSKVSVSNNHQFPYILG